ncbi:MAG: hydroxymethylbilane synthase [Chloroflexota bacterium]
MDRPVIVGTRASALALWQTTWVVGEVRRHHPALDVRIERVSSPGDRLVDVPLTAIGERGLFTRDLDEALRDERIDLAVHSLKDVPGLLPAGLVIGAVPPREDPADVLVAPAGSTPLRDVADLAPGARVGTDSTRRAAQLLHLRPDLRVAPVRGNVDTRLRKLDAGEYDVLVLAAAGLRRLGLAHRISLRLPPEVCLPAPGQGALAITVRGDDPRVPPLLAPLHHPATAAAVGAERALLRRLGGGCQTPIAALAAMSAADTVLRLRGVVAATDGTVLLRGEASGPASDGEALAENVADLLRRQGAGRLI